MFIFPSFLTPTTVAVIIGILLPYIVPVALIILAIWVVQKLNNIDKALKKISAILEITKNE